ncbi:MAG: hypothetical protein ACLFQQ_11565 [Desulfococcaceae bacterium]
MAVFLKHGGNCRTRAAAEIQTDFAGADSLQKRLGQARQKPAVPGIVRPIFMTVVLRFFGGGIKMESFGDENQQASRTAKVGAMPIGMEILHSRTAT